MPGSEREIFTGRTPWVQPHKQTVGIIGTGNIGIHVAKILNGSGCKVLAYAPYPNSEMSSLGAEYLELSDLFSQSDIVTLHCLLMPATHHIINGDVLSQMKPGVMLINTSRAPWLIPRRRSVR